MIKDNERRPRSPFSKAADHMFRHCTRRAEKAQLARLRDRESRLDEMDEVRWCLSPQ